ncbi:LuxR C-terminal-related transcriptional regulator [Actinomadura syzygii]|uniref:LuxR C-terminal-related transcriptional regulator n=1 Tax=Actinomadura syzygii TaxID=1427538 RepID=UPI001FEBA5AA|nr:LuxR C-terminal-related transcriptional regulator [Actinomadura syzygii]
MTGDEPQVRVAAIDDDTLIRDGLRVLVPGLDVVAACRDVAEFLAVRPRVEVVLLDLTLTGTATDPVLQGTDAVAALAADGWRVLVYTNERRRAVLVACLNAGARGVVHKAEPLPALAAAAADVAAGRIVITQALTGLAELAGRRGRLPDLSPRERDVLAGRARGESFRSIARRLFITEKTASGYMDQVKHKFAAYLREHSPADLERALGLEPSGLTDRHPRDALP